MFLIVLPIDLVCNILKSIRYISLTAKEWSSSHMGVVLVIVRIFHDGIH